MNSKYMVVIAAMAVMLIGATAFATDSAFAGGHGHKKSYEKSQATSQVKRLWQRILSIECRMSKHCITDSGR